jgi:NAD(P)-dependent dehydrogenase (short-subunit alcohol dehydrogenase family)
MTDPLFDVSGLTVLAAGGAGGLGKVLAQALAERGARVTVADFDAEAAAEVAESLPGEGHGACVLDVRDEESCNAAVADAASRATGTGGRLDVLLNCAGIFRTAPALELAAKDFADSIAINLTGSFVLARAAGAVMVAQGGGRIITLASVSSQVVNPDFAAYASSKAGLSHLTRVLALEWAAKGVTVNAIGPAVVPTPLVEDFLKRTGKYDYQMGRIPMGRFCTAEDLIGAALLLASPAGAFITGQTIYVDGGRTLV